jgi:DNA polymerase (family 10)
MENAQVAAIFDEIADLLEIQEANPFRVRSYRNAARTIRDLSQRVEDLAEEGKDLTDLPNIGDSTAEKIHEILDTGTCQRLEELTQEMPEELTELMNVPGLGPRKAKLVYDELGVESLDDLKQACEDGRVRELEGMGEKTEQNILQGIATVKESSGRLLYNAAADHVQSLARHLDKIDELDRWEVAGSFRRCKETIGDLDVLVQAKDREKASERILDYGPIDDVLGRGEEKVSVRLDSGLQIDFRYFEAEAFGAALMYFTGSKAHNIALRRRAQDNDWKLNEYGLFKGENRLAGKDEESIYHRLNLSWVAPELREDRGEVGAAEKDELPGLVDLKHIHGDLQSHTTASDGSNTIEEMARAAQEFGHQYLAITDHSKRVTMANGLNDDEALKHADAIREVDETLDDFWLLAGIEVDILKSGKLDLEEKTLEQLDWVMGSIHYDRNLSKEKMTNRLLAAIQSGVIHSIAHPLGRIIGKRDALDFDLETVYDACREHGVCIEINAQPDRLDLPDIYCKEARDAGVTFTIGTDAHKQGGLDFIRFGVNVARRGWLERKHLLNTKTAKQLRKALEKD